MFEACLGLLIITLLLFLLTGVVAKVLFGDKP